MQQGETVVSPVVEPLRLIKKCGGRKGSRVQNGFRGRHVLYPQCPLMCVLSVGEGGWCYDFR